MAHAVHAVHQQVIQGRIASEDVTADTIEQQLYTQVCPNANSASIDVSLLSSRSYTCYVSVHASKCCNQDLVTTVCHELHPTHLLSDGCSDEAEDKTHKSAGWLPGWLVGRLVGWLIVWLTDWLVGWLVD